MLSRRALLVWLCGYPLLRTITAKPNNCQTVCTDNRGLIVQSDGDQGDTAQREGWAWFGNWVLGAQLKQQQLALPLSFADTIKLLEIDQSGIFRRHPDKWNDPNDFSRDQQTPLVAAMGVWKRNAPLERLYHRMLERHWRCQNKDFAGPDHRNLFARALEKPLWFSGDLQILASSALIVAKTDPDDVGDDLNHIINLLMAYFVSPTRTSEEARTVYCKQSANLIWVLPPEL